ncbi:hypothetical protein CDEST_15447 [Colletotrichum destructivum]|uniref:Uncharacterized protein n=1 Tax=Colletotrichum destructivum TaxID=34406 RepID=A0AAX4J4C7_9PEZI|nr:hypothetical protein CDEST_15447 [Colletotrichum destructivum]
MIEVTIGYVASFIAAAVVIAQIWCPTVMALVIAGLLRDTETVATWNIASRVLQRTWWPTILASDSVLTHGARFKITLVSWAVPGVAVLIAIAGIVTPLGLYEQLEILDTRVGSFAYVRDLSSFGSATSQRGVHDFSRICSWGQSKFEDGDFNFSPAPCPYSGNSVIVSGGSRTLNSSMPDDYSFNGNSIITASGNMTLTFTMPYGYSSKIAPMVREIFSSGTTNQTTISNFFDIEWRQLTTRQHRFADHGTEVPVGLYRQLESHIMDSTIRVVEGLVVDGISGGIGLRNHTIPKNIERGASWSEDLLFIEPIASCVNTNLTLDFEVETNRSFTSTGIRNLRLTDRGGFVHMNQTNPSYDYENAQANPDLHARAYRAAYFNNAYTMMYFNVTARTNKTAGQKVWSYVDSTMGKEFPIADQHGTNYRALTLSSKFGNYLDFTWTGQYGRGTNPFGVATNDFLNANLACSGAIGDTLANTSNIYVRCGLLRGVPQRVDGDIDSTLFENHSKWSSSMHVCASALRAVVKTVGFTVDSTNDADGLAGLQVTSIAVKNYGSSDEFPIWAMEDSGLLMAGISPVWGLVSPEYASRPNVSTVKQQTFHLPGYSRSVVQSPLNRGFTFYNLPASDFPSNAMDLLFEGDTEEGALGNSWPFDLRGAANMPVFKRWQALSNDSERVADIIKLVWTDIAASAVVGTKGTLGPGNNAAANKTVTIFIKPTGKRIKYRWVFGIPAFILLLAMLVVTVAMLLYTALQASSIAVLRHRLQQLTVGRILTTVLYPEDSNLFMSSKEWSHSNGHKAVSLDTVPRKGIVCETALRPFQHHPETPIENVAVSLIDGGKSHGN